MPKRFSQQGIPRKHTDGLEGLCLLFRQSESQNKVNFERVTKESEDLIEECLKQCKNGSKGIDPQIWSMDATTANGLISFTSFLSYIL